MERHDATNDRPDWRDPPDLVEAGVYPDSSAGFDHALVVLAVGESCCLAPSPAGYRLLVEPAALEFVREQLACYDRESVGWPPPEASIERPARQADFFTPLLWALAVMAVFWCQRRWPNVLEAAGDLNARAVFDQGEWWRSFTALFLHANVGHLVSNLLSGYFAFVAVLTTIGRGRGWLLLAVAAVAGNLAAAAINYPGPYQSLGASTAIFAGLGLLTGRAVRGLRRPGRTHPWRAVLAPLAAGGTLLAMFGAGGAHTDVGAHLTGFSAGLLLGFAAGLPRRDREIALETAGSQSRNQP